MTDHLRKCFYILGGYSLHPNEIWPDTPDPWRFCDDYGSGQGAWDRVDLPPSSYREFQTLPYLDHTAFTSTEDAGFMFGGRDDMSDSNSKHYFCLNFTTLAWTKHVIVDRVSEDGTLWGSEAIYVPNYGPNGLIFIIGGLSGWKTDYYRYLKYDTLHFLDPVTKIWYEQNATVPLGDYFPSEVHQPCVAGLKGANNTYDM
jgi:hypothetical protein